MAVSMGAGTLNCARVTVDGKFFRLNGEKFFVCGVTYGPLRPQAQDGPFSSEEQTRVDFQRICHLGATVLRVYEVPPRWFLDLANAHGLKLLVDVPWDKKVCFLDRAETREQARTAIANAVKATLGHPAIFAYSMVNEIPADIVRWHGAERVAEFIDELVAVAKAVDPDCLCTFGNFPTTEFLTPQTIDFQCFNVYLHRQQPFENYLRRLQTLSVSRPLVLGEVGIDSIREGEETQAEVLSWKIESSFRTGLAGLFIYSYTDEWYKDGVLIEDWAFGLTRADRTPKPAFAAVRRQFSELPRFPLPEAPRVSIVVASYNGAATLRTCLDSLSRLHYPDYEVILVDDGSTDTTPQIASLYPSIRTIRHPVNQGLSVARNTGIAAARGEIIAFTDADCRADEDWLYYLVGDLVRTGFAGMGGPNYLPADDSCIAAAVMASPGGPAHVLLTDVVAEHIPGCNMAFYRWALLEIGCFDPIFTKAGDDVDICWRLQQRGYRIGFSPSAFVWHYRRSTIGAYLRQQMGYGDAEALLALKHPEYFNSIGGNLWQGRIYSSSALGVWMRPSIIYHGRFGTGMFQCLYAAQPVGYLTLLTSLEYQVLVTLPLAVLSVPVTLLAPVAATNALLVLILCGVAALQADLPRSKQRIWSRPLIALLHLLQPIVRGFARHRGHLISHQSPLDQFENLDTLSREAALQTTPELAYTTRHGMGRVEFLDTLLNRLDRHGWQNKTDTGWNRFDIEVYGQRWTRIRLLSVGEESRAALRIRMTAAWTLAARVTFSILIAIELVAIGVLSGRTPWIWLLLATPPIAIFWLDRQKKDLLRVLSVFIDQTAQEAGLSRADLPSVTSKDQPVVQTPGLVELERRQFGEGR